MPDHGNINEPGARVKFPIHITQQKAPAVQGRGSKPAQLFHVSNHNTDTSCK